jgi:hypothetical protein
MREPLYRIAHVSEIQTPAAPRDGVAPWLAVRRHFGIGSFGVSAYVAERGGDVFTSVHEESDTRHEELFYVASGRVVFTVEDETFEAPVGTFVYVRDPALRRGAAALEPGTTLLAMGGEPGRAFEVSSWEQDEAAGE